MNDLGIDNAPAISGPPRWMMSFADLMSVILTFFVLLFSMSVPPHSKDKIDNNMSKTAEATFAVSKTEVETNIKTAKTDQGMSTNYLTDVIKNKIAISPELAKARLVPDDEKLAISIKPTEFDDAYAKGMAGILKTLDNRVAIYSVNLDQSRAVMKKLQENGLEKNISFLESQDASGKIDIVIYP